MPGLAGVGQPGPQLGRSGPLTSLPGSELNLGQRPEEQVRRTTLRSCCSLVSQHLFWLVNYGNVGCNYE